MQMISSAQSENLKRCRGMKTACGIRWRCFLVKPSKPEFGKSWTNGRAGRTGRARNTAATSRYKPHRSVSGTSGSVKRVVDIFISGIALVILFPLMALIAAVVRLADGGSVFYRQTRIGLNGHRFTILKFRSMHEDAERHLGAIWSVPNDPRCTWAGHYL